MLSNIQIQTIKNSDRCHQTHQNFSERALTNVQTTIKVYPRFVSGSSSFKTFISSQILYHHTYLMKFEREVNRINLNRFEKIIPWFPVILLQN